MAPNHAVLDPEVRVAGKVLVGGRAVLATGLLPPTHWAYNGDVARWQHDIARATQLLDEAGRSGIAGGAVYDALIGATAAHHNLTLLTRDRRARWTYDAIGARYSVI